MKLEIAEIKLRLLLKNKLCMSRNTVVKGFRISELGKRVKRL